MAGLQNDPGTVQQEAGFGFDGRFWTESYTDNLTALAGGARAGATQLPSMFNRVATVATAGDSVMLPPGSKPGLSVCVINAASNPITVYAQAGSSDTINGIAAATGATQMGNSVVWYSVVAAATWHAQGLGTGYSGSQGTYSYADALTANHSPGGQAGGTLITTSTARFTTVGAAGDSATLMTAVPGLIITVINAGANILNVFPATGDQINALGANNAFALPPGGVAEFFTTVAGTWHTLVQTTGGAQQAYNGVANTSGFTLTGAQITGGSERVFLDLTGTLGGSANAQLPTVAALVSAMTVAGLNPQAGMTYELWITERSASNTWTITTNTGWTLNNTMTLGTGGFTRIFIVSLTSLSAASLTSIGSVTLAAK